MSLTKYLIYPLTLMLLLVPLSVRAEESIESTSEIEMAPEDPVMENGGAGNEAAGEESDVPADQPDISEDDEKPETETVALDGTESVISSEESAEADIMSDMETVMEPDTEIPDETMTESEFESESESKEPILDEETGELLKRYLLSAVSGNDVQDVPQQTQSETVTPEMDSLFVQVDRAVELLSVLRTISLASGVITVIGLGLLIGLQVFRRMH